MFHDCTKFAFLLSKMYEKAMDICLIKCSRIFKDDIRQLYIKFSRAHENLKIQIG